MAEDFDLVDRRQFGRRGRGAARIAARRARRRRRGRPRRRYLRDPAAACQEADDVRGAVRRRVRGGGLRLVDRRAAVRDGPLGGGQAAETARLEGVYRGCSPTAASSSDVEGWGAVAGPGRTRRAHARPARPRRDRRRAGARQPARHRTGATSDDLLDLTDLPPRAAVVGSVATSRSSSPPSWRGSGVGGEPVLPPPRCRCAFRRRPAPRRHRTAGRHTLHPGRRRSPCSAPAAAAARLRRRHGARDFPFVLNATGRRPNTARLGLESVGLATGANDAIRSMPAGTPRCRRARDRRRDRPSEPDAGRDRRSRALADTLFGGGCAGSTWASSRAPCS